MSAPSAAKGAVPAGWRSQPGAFAGRPAAEAAWGDARSRSPELGGRSPHFEPVPGKPMVCLQVKGVETRNHAIRLCAHAAAAGFDCIPVKPA